MYKPSRGGQSGGKRFGAKKFGGNDRGDRYGSDRRERNTPMLYDAVCAECANACQVPFRPNGKKPVLCRDCFGGNEGSAPMRKPSPRAMASRPAANMPSADTALLREISAKLDAILTALHA